MNSNYLIDNDNGSHPMSPYYVETIDFDEEPVKKCWLHEKVGTLKYCSYCKRFQVESNFVYRDKCLNCFTKMDKEF